MNLGEYYKRMNAEIERIENAEGLWAAHFGFGKVCGLREAATRDKDITVFDYEFISDMWDQAAHAHAVATKRLTEIQ